MHLGGSPEPVAVTEQMQSGYDMKSGRTAFFRSKVILGEGRGGTAQGQAGMPRPAFVGRVMPCREEGLTAPDGRAVPSSGRRPGRPGAGAPLVTPGWPERPLWKRCRAGPSSASAGNLQSFAYSFSDVKAGGQARVGA